MRYCFIVCVLAVCLGCHPAGKLHAVDGPLVLHVWIYYGQDAGALQRVIDSSRLRYVMVQEREGDGIRRFEFSFSVDPGAKKMEKLLKRLARYPGKRSFATTRGKKQKEL